MIALIINRDLLSWPRKLAADLAARGCVPVFVDNASTFPPLLRWYRRCPYRIFHTDNLGHASPFGEPLRACIREGWIVDRFIVTDPDLSISRVPLDMLAHLQKGFAFGRPRKVGLSLAIDDLSDNAPLSAEVQAWESQFWQHERAPGFYEAGIHGTIAMDALYDGATEFDWRDHRTNCLRAAPPYVARHLPWYLLPGNVGRSYRYYLERASASTHWAVKLRDALGIER